MMNENLIGGEMMFLTTGDLTSNRFVQRCSGIESLKPAMLKHELIFRNQVRELHRLYWTQKNLMNELHLKGFDTHASSSSSWVAMTKCKGSIEETNQFSELSCGKENVNSLEQLKGKPDEVTSNHGINYKLHDPGYDCDSEVLKINEFVDATVKGHLGCGFVKIVERNKSHFSTSLCCEEVIDLGVSVKLGNDEEAKDAFSGIKDQTHKIESLQTCFSYQISSTAVGNEKHPISYMVHGGVLQDKKPFISYVGLGDSSVTTLVDDQSRVKQRCKPLLIDLNIPHDQNDPTQDCIHKFDFLYLHDEIVRHDYVKKASCESGGDPFSCHGQDSKPLTSVEFMLPFNIIKDKDHYSQVQGECFEKPIEGSTGSNDEAYIQTDSFFSINSCKQDKDVMMLSPVHGDNKRQVSYITSSNSTNPSQSVVQGSINKLGCHEGSEEDTSSSHAIKRAEDLRKLPSGNFLTECNSDVPLILIPNFEEPAALSNTSTAEEDLTIAEAAKALMGISLKIDCNDRDSHHMHSSDSFESMTLQLSELQSEVLFSIPNPSNVSETKKSVSGVKLRRGRGLRDFQKEILPGLAALARHEICEDLHNIGHKLRRTASRNARDKWLTPFRDQKSRLYSGCQRN